MVEHGSGCVEIEVVSCPITAADIASQSSVTSQSVVLA